jgi:hypothetical protein
MSIKNDWNGQLLLVDCFKNAVTVIMDAKKKPEEILEWDRVEKNNDPFNRTKYQQLLNENGWVEIRVQEQKSENGKNAIFYYLAKIKTA